MRSCSDVSTLALAAGETTPLRDAKGTRIECLNGSLWITQHRDRRDVVLAPGAAFTLDRDGVALLHAFEPSVALVIESREMPADSPWWKRAGAAFVCYFMRLGMSRVAWRRAYRL